MLVKADDAVTYTNQLSAHLVWMAESPMQPGKEYLFKFATKVTVGSVDKIHHRIDVNELQLQPAERMQLNDIAKVDVGLQQPVVVDNYQRNRGTGAFIVIDRLTNVTVGAGMVEEARAFNAAAAPSEFSAFELELNSLIRKHFPHWEAKDLSLLKK
jgi:sulfate adenylyltransferase subunit 1